MLPIPIWETVECPPQLFGQPSHDKQYSEHHGEACCPCIRIADQKGILTRLRAGWHLPEFLPTLVSSGIG